MKNIRITMNKICKNTLLLTLLGLITSCNNPTNVFYGKSILSNKEPVKKVVMRRKPIENSQSYYSEEFKKEFRPSSYSSANYENIYNKYLADEPIAKKNIYNPNNSTPKENLNNLSSNNTPSPITPPAEPQIKVQNLNKPSITSANQILQDIGEATPNINSLDNTINQTNIPIQTPTVQTPIQPIAIPKTSTEPIVNNSNIVESQKLESNITDVTAKALENNVKASNNNSINQASIPNSDNSSAKIEKVQNQFQQELKKEVNSNKKETDKPLNSKPIPLPTFPIPIEKQSSTNYSNILIV